MIFVSGRPCEELITLAGLSHPVEVWGCHGREYRDLSGNITYHGITPVQAAALATEYARAKDIVPDNKLELKTGCLALHWRGLSEETREAVVGDLEPRWSELAAEHDLKLLNFDGGIELAIPGRTKGDAVEQLLSRGEHHGLPTAFLGDDLTDEDGFRALGDRGLSVLVRNEPRETAADIRITMPDGVLAFLRRWRDTLSSANIRKGETS